MRIIKLWKSNNSGKSGCPALYEADEAPAGYERYGDDWYAVQGVKLSPEVMAQLDQLGADENAVLVPAEILDRLREQR